MTPRVHRRAELKTHSIALSAVLLQRLRDDLRHRQLLENPLISAQRQIAELRHYRQPITVQTFAGFTLGHWRRSARDTFTVWGEGQEGELVQQAVQVEIRLFADQLEAAGLAAGVAQEVR